MNFEKFKNVKTKPCDITLNEKYAKKLAHLPQSRNIGRILAAVGTVAAAVTIVVVVGVWALIGRGIRGTEQNAVYIVEGSYAEIPVSDELNAKLNMDLFGKYDVFCFREFDKNNPLSVQEILQLNKYAKNALTAHDPVTHGAYTSSANGNLAYVTGKELNEYAKNMFGITPADENAIYGCEIELGDVDYAGAKVKKISTEDLSDGTKKIRIEYNDFTKLRVLEYVGYDLFTPIRFTAFYKDDTELTKSYFDQKIYKALCDELDACDYIESYLLYIPEPPKEYNGGKCSAKIVVTPTFTDGMVHSVLGSMRQYDNKTELAFSCDFETAQDGKLELIKADEGC